MADEEKVMLVLTVEGPKTIFLNGGTQYWRVAKGRAERCSYAILVQNQSKAQEMKGEWREFATGTENDDVAFFVGRRLHVEETDEPGRQLIRFDEYAEVRAPNFWTGDRYPIRYLSLAEVGQMGLDPEKLEFKPMPEPAKKEPSGGQPLSIAEAKRGLALHFEVPEANVEITIRG
jgi:hypothetical protein